jgi:hypothetical protein
MIEFIIKLKRLRCALFCNKPLKVSYYEKVNNELIMFATCPTCGLDYAVIKDKEK